MMLFAALRTSGITFCCIGPEPSVSELLIHGTQPGSGRARFPLTDTLRQQTMIWVPVVGLGVGALLAQRFKIVVLLPATLAVAVVALGVATTQSSVASSTILIVVMTSVSMQAGYLAGMLVRRGIGGTSRVPSFSQPTSARDPAP
jgi:hypothetical protein